ncbi:putative pterin-4-alpha-carbinolamine dehydratase [Enhygromyxa salina]|uniref:Putative pterin-4-alpha-carbinolamine dehydratase n=1 Tax=Enhygromyxa salina TaxID=215803 RepID=A0A2S9YEB3_9BACT|nr:4a-hydroxytetrahydrobiopterin dehydratase [Enhygromyxa salina]PRQ03356.1 putative pterin-4-alpha-carbinolamine dehydratase [Enhygromyxa salina]
MSAPDNHVLDQDELRAALERLDGWTLEGDRLRKRFELADFRAAIAFMVRVAFDAERLGHHPNWSNVYKTVDVEIWSHDLGGVSALCVELAQAMDDAAASSR